MTDAELIARLREGFPWMKEVADRIEALIAERDEALGEWDKAIVLADKAAALMNKMDTRRISAEAKLAALVETLDRTTSLGQRSEYSRVGHHLNEASWHVHLAGFKCRGDAEAFLTAALTRVKGVM
jgi:hypothetical protein